MEFFKAEGCDTNACVEVAFFKAAGCGEGACVEVGFVKSPLSGGGGCVEVNRDGACSCGGDEVRVRDSKNQDGPVLSFTREEWKAFIGGVKNNEFDVV